MASFLCQVQTIQRSQGRSAVAAAAYRSGQSLVDERLAMEFDFARKDGIEFSEIILPPEAPAAFSDRATLWNAAERRETRKDGVPAREVLLALPHELDFEQRRTLVRAFVAEHITARGMVADVAMHEPGRGGDDRNFHAHILVTTRRTGTEGLGAKDPSWWSPRLVREWRSGWADIQNQHLRRHLGPQAPQVSHLSLSERGESRAPTQHLGPAATALERRGRLTERGDRNRDATARNRLADSLRRDYSDTADRIASRAPMIDAAVETLIAEGARVRAELVAERAAFQAQREQLAPSVPPSKKQVERELMGTLPGDRARARAAQARTEERVAETRSRRFALVAWIRHPARMIWAKHAELNALARARKAVRETDQLVLERQDWLRSPAGLATVAARRQPGLDAAADAARARRTLERKIKRIDRRLEASERTLKDLIVAQELGSRRLRVPSRSPDATRFIRDVGTSAREAVSRHPAPAQRQAIERLSRGQGRTMARSLFPGR